MLQCYMSACSGHVENIACACLAFCLIIDFYTVNTVHIFVLASDSGSRNNNELSDGECMGYKGTSHSRG